MNKLSYNHLLSLGAISLLAGFNGCSPEGNQRNSELKRPNIIYILADDLGYADLGCYGQKKIETPNIDQLAAEGMRFTQHYTSAPVCAPARYMLLTGVNSGSAQVRGNDEWTERGDVRNYYAMIADSSLEGQWPMKAGTVTMGNVLQSIGYKTAIVGKWGLGAPHSEGAPNKQGFDFFYGYICQRMAHTFYPVHLWKNTQKDHLDNDTIPPHASFPEGADPYDIKSYAQFMLNEYSTVPMYEEINNFVNENEDNPFFLYWATPIPHVPLQAPQKWIDYYVKKFGDEEPYLGRVGRGGYYPQRYPMATYAAMISFMDEQVGMLVNLLKEKGLYENTLIMFSSDNGPIGPHGPHFESAAPFKCESGYGKGNLHEGGIRVPMIATWPKVIKPGTVSQHISAHYDVFPTVAEITGAEIQAEISGISFLPALKGNKQKEHEYMYWEFPESRGQMAVRMGDLKALRKNMHEGNTHWELFNLADDPQETTDISEKHPDVIARVEEIVAKEHVPSNNEKFKFKVLGD